MSIDKVIIIGMWVVGLLTWTFALVMQATAPDYDPVSAPSPSAPVVAVAHHRRVRRVVPVRTAAVGLARHPVVAEAT